MCAKKTLSENANQTNFNERKMAARMPDDRQIDIHVRCEALDKADVFCLAVRNSRYNMSKWTDVDIEVIRKKVCLMFTDEHSHFPQYTNTHAHRANSNILGRVIFMAEHVSGSDKRSEDNLDSGLLGEWHACITVMQMSQKFVGAVINKPRKLPYTVALAFQFEACTLHIGNGSMLRDGTEHDRSLMSSIYSSGSTQTNVRMISFRSGCDRSLHETRTYDTYIATKCALSCMVTAIRTSEDFTAARFMFHGRRLQRAFNTNDRVFRKAVGAK